MNILPLSNTKNFLWKKRPSIYFFFVGVNFGVEFENELFNRLGVIWMIVCEENGLKFQFIIFQHLYERCRFPAWVDKTSFLGGRAAQNIGKIVEWTYLNLPKKVYVIKELSLVHHASVIALVLKSKKTCI